MTSIRIPPGVRFPAVVAHAADDTHDLDAAGVWALMQANPQLEWNEETLLHALAYWYLHETETGRSPALPDLQLPMVMPATFRRH